MRRSTRVHGARDGGRCLHGFGIFIEGWIVELIAPTYDAELEKTHAYALVSC